MSTLKHTLALAELTHSSTILRTHDETHKDFISFSDWQTWPKSLRYVTVDLHTNLLLVPRFHPKWHNPLSSFFPILGPPAHTHWLGLSHCQGPLSHLPRICLVDLQKKSQNTITMQWNQYVIHEEVSIKLVHQFKIVFRIFPWARHPQQRQLYKQNLSRPAFATKSVASPALSLTWVTIKLLNVF